MGLKGHFALQKRTFVGGASTGRPGGEGGAPSLYDLRMLFEGETQARHLEVDLDPSSAPRMACRVCAGTGAEKLRLGMTGPVRIKPGATGPKASLNPTEKLTAVIEGMDRGRVEIVSDKPGAKLFRFKGKRMKGSFLLQRRGKDKFALIRRRDEFSQDDEELQMADSFKPPKTVQSAARRGLELRNEFGRGGTATGIARARDLAGGKSIPLGTIQRMNRFFIRHEKNKDTPPEKGNGKIAWLLWGGDPGKRWVESILRRMEAEIDMQVEDELGEDTVDEDETGTVDETLDDNSDSSTDSEGDAPIPFPYPISLSGGDDRLSSGFECYADPASAARRARELGGSGWHLAGQNGMKAFRPCQDAEELASLIGVESSAFLDDVPGASGHQEERLLFIVNKMMGEHGLTDDDHRELQDIRARILAGTVTKGDVAKIMMYRSRVPEAMFDRAPLFFHSDNALYAFKMEDARVYDESKGRVGLCEFHGECPALEASDERLAAMTCQHAKRQGCPIFLDDVRQVTKDELEQQVTRHHDGTVDVSDYELLRVGRWNGIDFTKEHIKEIIANFNKFQGYLEVPIKIGHHGNQSLLENSGELAAGWVTKVYPSEDETRLLSELRRIPRKVWALKEKGALRNRSIEMFRNFTDQAGKKVGRTLKALSFLGSSTPAVPGMEPIRSLDDALALYSMDETRDIEVFTYEEKDEENMSDDTKKTGTGAGVDEVVTFSREEFEAAMKQRDEQAAKEMQKRDSELEELKQQLKQSEEQRVKDRKAQERREVDRMREQNVEVFSRLLKDGKVLPKQKDRLIGLLNSVDTLEDAARKGGAESLHFEGGSLKKDTLKFSLVETDEAGNSKEVEFGVKELLLSIIGDWPKAVEFETTSKTGSSTDGDEVDRTRVPGSKGDRHASEILDEMAQKIMVDEKVEDYSVAYALAGEKAIKDGVLTVEEINS